MKILQVISTMDPRAGGICQCVRVLTPHLGDVEIVTLDDPQAAFLGKDAALVHALGQGRGPWSYHSSLGPWLKANLPRFDAVVLNGLWQFPGYLLSRLAQFKNAPPYFVFPHGMLDPWFQRAPERRLKAVRNWFYWKLIERHVISRAAAVLFTCEEELVRAREAFHPYAPAREINTGLGVQPPPARVPAMDAAFFRLCPTVNGHPYFLFLGRIHPKKGIDLLIHAFAHISRADSAARLVIAGPGGETAHGRQLMALAGQKCPPHTVFWPGMLAGDAKWGALYNARAFVLPSHQENFGIAVVEALACAVPVLISRRVNIFREIEHDEAGLVGEDTIAGVKELFLTWNRRSAGNVMAMKSRARQCFQNRFSVDPVAFKLLGVLRNRASRPPGPVPAL